MGLSLSIPLLSLQLSLLLRLMPQSYSELVNKIKRLLFQLMGVSVDLGSRFKAVKFKIVTFWPLYKSEKQIPVLGSGTDMKDVIKQPGAALEQRARAAGDRLGYSVSSQQKDMKQKMKPMWQGLYSVSESAADSWSPRGSPQGVRCPSFSHSTATAVFPEVTKTGCKQGSCRRSTPSMKLHPAKPYGRRQGLEAGECNSKGLAGSKSKPSWLQGPGMLSGWLQGRECGLSV